MLLTSFSTPSQQRTLHSRSSPTSRVGRRRHTALLILFSLLIVVVVSSSVFFLLFFHAFDFESRIERRREQKPAKKGPCGPGYSESISLIPGDDAPPPRTDSEPAD